MKKIIAASILCVVAGAANAADGLIELKSAHSVTETGARLVAAIEARKLTLFARIDHAAGAKKIDNLPLKMLVWQTADGSVMLGYNDPAWLAKRHGAACEQPVGNIAKALDGIAKSVAAP